MPNINTNPLQNHGGGNVNIIEKDEDLCGMKMITPIFHDDLERVVSSLSVKEKRVFYFDTYKGCCLGAIRNSRQA